jgi:hypothetical protein
MADLFKREFVAASASSFSSWTLAAALIGAALVAAGLLLRVVGGPARRG